MCLRRWTTFLFWKWKYLAHCCAAVAKKKLEKSYGIMEAINNKAERPRKLSLIICLREDRREAAAARIFYFFGRNCDCWLRKNCHYDRNFTLLWGGKHVSRERYNFNFLRQFVREKKQQQNTAIQRSLILKLWFDLKRSFPPTSNESVKQNWFCRHES